MDTKDDGKTVGQLFLEAHQLYNTVESSNIPAGDPEFQSNVKKALVRVMRASATADRAGVISSNEELEDISSKDLKFVLLPYYRAMLMQKLTEKRIAAIKNALSSFNAFLKSCDQIRILDKGSRTVWEREAPLGPSGARTEKIERYRQEKAMKKRLEELTELLEHATLKEDHEAEDDVDIEREKWLTLIGLAVHTSLSDMSSLDRELEMLEAMEKMRGESGKERAPGSMRHPPPVRYPKGVVPVRETITIDKRGMIRKGVFHDRNPPTMSIEEYLELERQRGGIIEGGGEPEEKQENEEYGEKDEETLIQEQIKAREWDDWKDEHPKGAGNLGGNLG